MEIARRVNAEPHPTVFMSLWPVGTQESRVVPSGALLNTVRQEGNETRCEHNVDDR